MNSVREWLDDIGLGKYAEIFAAEEVDLRALAHLEESDLKDLGLPLGPRKTILAALAHGVPAAPRALDAKSDATPHSAERRQITVMFCDLVGSTALSERLDPEDLRGLMQAYQRAAGAVVERYDGHVAQYLGDGLMVYFGWPVAHEDDAERAVRAALEIVDAVKAVDAPAPLQVRVGIATGPVVVGDTGDGDASVPNLAVGETPNLASRMQGLASVDEIVIANTSHRLTAAVFDYDDLGEQSVKGLLAPVRSWRVVGVAAAESRLEAHGGHLSPLVGREQEIGLLMERWDRAQDGEGQVVLLSGEPGIGKSRIAQLLRERIAEMPHVRLRYQCSPYHSNTAFHPIVEQLERAARFATDDTVDVRLDKLEALLAQGTDTVDEIASFVAPLLSLPVDRYPSLGLSPQKHKERAIEALGDQLLGLSRTNPVLFLIEDVHWCDPSTLQLLGDTIGRIAEARVLMVATFRPEFVPPWSGHGHLTMHSLNRFGRRHAAKLAMQVADGKPLPEDVIDQIIAKTDGVPLFVEELTKTVLESGFLIDAGDHYRLDAPLPALAIPATLRDLLMARLDRLGADREVAQIGACLGRTFSYELLATVSEMAAQDLAEALNRLVANELLFVRGIVPNASYAFKHALVQDAAYDSLLKRNRQRHHGRIAAILESEFLAHHHTQAGSLCPVIAYETSLGY